MRIDPVRAVRATGLVIWAAFFIYLWVSDEAVNYVGARTAWVVPFGAITFTVIAVLYLPGVRTARRRPERPSVMEIVGALVVLAPVLVLFMVPSPSLGALAAKRKGGTEARRGLPPPEYESEQALTVADISWAMDNPEFREQRGIVDGTPVQVTGIVTRSGWREVEVTRFYTACCAADAIPYSIKVRAGNARDLGAEQWVRVKGQISIKGKALVVTTTKVQPIDEPDNPYLENG